MYRKEKMELKEGERKEETKERMRRGI